MRGREGRKTERERHEHHPKGSANSPHGFKHQTEMVLVEEVSVEPHTVKLVVSVCFVEFLKDVQLLKTGLMPTKITQKIYGVRG